MLTFPSVAGPRTAGLTQPSRQASGTPSLPLPYPQVFLVFLVLLVNCVVFFYHNI